MELLAGTSGYSYKEWLGRFYPEKLPADEMLRYYAGHFRDGRDQQHLLPHAGGGDARALGGARCRRISPSPSRRRAASRTRSACARRKRTWPSSCGARRALGDKLGVAPVPAAAVPASKDLPRLRDFLAALPAGRRVVFEFRHDSWQDDEVYADAARPRRDACA